MLLCDIRVTVPSNSLSKYILVIHLIEYFNCNLINVIKTSFKLYLKCLHYQMLGQCFNYFSFYQDMQLFSVDKDRILVWVILQQTMGRA